MRGSRQEPTPLRGRWSAAIAPAALAALWLCSLFAPLLSPGWALANRDIPLFHLPLRASFHWLAGIGLPVWNPWLHGGQPVLSNPSYAAFYPPSWLVFLAGPHYTLNLLTLLHAGIAFFGAWRLTRRLGGGPGAAALAAVGYVGCGAYLSLLSAFTLFCSMAWFPWVLAWGDAALRAPAREPWLRPALLCGTALAFQLLNGEPSTVVMSGLGLLALAASAAGRRAAAALRVPVPVVVAVLLAAVQLLPTQGRLADSPRSGGLKAGEASVWSMPPERLVEIAFPRFFGDPTREPEGLYLGWSLNDRNYPYVASLYPGLLLAVLGFSALLLWRIPRRAAWGLVFAGGIFLALGRHNPLFEGVRAAIPGLAMLRFPEKFALMAVAALVVAGALGWHWLLEERSAGRPQKADFPLAVALVLLGTALGLAALLHLAPRAAAWYVRSQGIPNLSPERQAAALSFLRAESWAAVGVTAAVAVLLALCRWRRPSRRLLESLALLLLAADLWRYGHRLIETIPTASYREPPRVARSLLPPRDRIFVQPAPDGAPELCPLTGDLGTARLRAQIARLEPYSGILWQIPQAFHEDYDLMLTGAARQAVEVLRAEWRQPESAFRFLGVWNVGTVLLRKTPERWVAELARDPGTPAVDLVGNPFVLPRYRFLPRVNFHPTYEAALRAARAERFAVAASEHCVRPGPPGFLDYSVPPRPLSISDQGGRIRVHYRAEGGAFFVAAVTFDPGWQASLDGSPLEVHATAASQLGVALPPGEHRLLLEYRDPLVARGAAVTLTTLAVCIALWFVGGKRRAALT
jgi:hypothetical protein